MGDKGGKKDKEKNKQQQVTKHKQEEQKKQDKNRPRPVAPEDVTSSMAFRLIDGRTNPGRDRRMVHSTRLRAPLRERRHTPRTLRPLDGVRGDQLLVSSSAYRLDVHEVGEFHSVALSICRQGSTRDDP